jgi:hypothetical protein
MNQNLYTRTQWCIRHRYTCAKIPQAYWQAFLASVDIFPLVNLWNRRADRCFSLVIPGLLTLNMNRICTEDAPYATRTRAHTHRHHTHRMQSLVSWVTFPGKHFLNFCSAIPTCMPIGPSKCIYRTCYMHGRVHSFSDRLVCCHLPRTTGPEAYHHVKTPYTSQDWETHIAQNRVCLSSQRKLIQTRLVLVLFLVFLVIVEVTGGKV